MKKIAFIFRDSDDAKYILSKLFERNIYGDIILEVGKSAKHRKLQRMFRVPFYKYPFVVLDVGALLLYSSIMSKGVWRSLGKYSYPDTIHMKVDDVNESAVMQYLQTQKPVMVFIYGTAILRDSLLKKSPVPFFNIHTGIVPKYRNVHSDFWAYINRDFRQIGVTIMQLDSGIDSGDILVQKSIEYKSGDSLVTAKVKNLKLIVELVTVIVTGRKGTIRKVKQDSSKSSHYHSPRFLTLLKFFIHRKKS